MIVSSWSTVQVHYNSKSFFEIGTPFYKAFTVWNWLFSICRGVRTVLRGDDNEQGAHGQHEEGRVALRGDGIFGTSPQQVKEQFWSDWPCLNLNLMLWRRVQEIAPRAWDQL